MEDIMKIFKSFKKSVLLSYCIKRASEAIKNEPKEQKDGFLGMLLGTLGASLGKSVHADDGILQVG